MGSGDNVLAIAQNITIRAQGDHVERSPRRGFVLTLQPMVNPIIQHQFPLLTAFAPHKRITTNESIPHKRINPAQGVYRNKSRSIHYSHLRMLLSCMEDDISPCLILEDDVLLAPNASIRLDQVLRERPKENLILLGTSIRSMRYGNISDVRLHTAVLAGSGGGCHGYIVRDPQALLRELLARHKPVKGVWEDQVCVEHLNRKTVVSRESLVWQRSKKQHQYCIYSDQKWVMEKGC